MNYTRKAHIDLKWFESASIELADSRQATNTLLAGILATLIPAETQMVEVIALDREKEIESTWKGELIEFQTCHDGNEGAITVAIIKRLDDGEIKVIYADDVFSKVRFV